MSQELECEVSYINNVTYYLLRREDTHHAHNVAILLTEYFGLDTLD